MKNPIVKCQGCGTFIRWTEMYGFWCTTCKPRFLRESAFTDYALGQGRN